MTKIAICIATCQRPKSLGRLLESLGDLRFEKSRDVDVRIVVVDNDAEGSAREVVAVLAEKLPWTVEYGVEPVRGIPFARNRSVRMAGDVDFVAFIDDDEVADPLWLDELLSAQSEYGAGIVHGPVINRYEPGTPEWYIKSGVVEQKRFATGSSPGWVCTNNVLVKLDPLRKLDGPFDIAYGHTGADDIDLFARLRNLGVRNVWADEAVVEEHIPTSRATLGWVARRQYRVGCNEAIISRKMAGSGNWRLKSFGTGLHYIHTGATAFIVSIRRGRAGLARPLGSVMRGLGLIGGIFGVRLHEYKNIHGQ